MFHAAKDLRRSDPAFDSLFRRYIRSCGATYLMAAAASEPASFQKAVLQNADMQIVIAMLRDDARAFPDNRSTYEWAMLKNADAGEASKAASAIRGNPRMLIEQSITSLLQPCDASQALDSYWLMQILDKSDAGREAIRKVAAMGIPVPVQQ